MRAFSHRTGKQNLRQAVRRTVGPLLQALEPRVLLSDVPPPIGPTTGEANLLDIVDSLPVKEIKNALDRFPVPYVIQTQWFGPASSSVSVSGDPQPLSTPITVTLNNKAGVDNGFIFQTTDTSGDPVAFESISLLTAVSQDSDQIAELRRAFQQTAPGPIGAVLDGSTPSRINYSPYLQAIDFAYYDAGDAPRVLDRLALLYADGAVLDTTNDHVALRNLGASNLLTDLLLRGFQAAAGLAEHRRRRHPFAGRGRQLRLLGARHLQPGHADHRLR